MSLTENNKEEKNNSSLDASDSLSENGDIEDQQKTLDHRFREILNEFTKQSKIINDLNSQIAEQNKKIDLNEKFNREQYNEYNKLIEDMEKKTEELHMRVGNTDMIQIDTLNDYNCNYDEVEVEQHLPLVLDTSKEIKIEDNLGTSHRVLVFSIPAFFCCLLRLIYAIAGIVFFEFREPKIIYFMSCIISPSIIFEMFAIKMKGILHNLIYILYAISNTVALMICSNLLKINFDAKKSFLKAAIVSILAEALLIVALKSGEERRTINRSHYCGLSSILLLACATGTYNPLPYIVASVVFLVMQSIFIISGLPKIKQREFQKKDSNGITSHDKSKNMQTIDDDVRNSSDEEMSISSGLNQATNVSTKFQKKDSNGISYHDKSKNMQTIHDDVRNASDEEMSISFHSNQAASVSTNSIADILHQLHQRIEMLESKEDKEREHHYFNLFRPKGLSSDWATRAQLSSDVYTMMMLSHWTQKSFRNPCQCCKNNPSIIVLPCPSKSWLLGFLVFTVQSLLAIFTLIDQLDTSFGDTLMNIPIRITAGVRVGQFLTLILAVMTQTDVLISYRVLLFLSPTRNNWQELIKHENNENKYSLWFGRIAIPNLMKGIQGIVVLLTTFIVIIQSDNIVELLKDFTALFVVSSIDDMFFFMADHGYLGPDLSRKTNIAKKISIEEDDRMIRWYLHTFFFLVLSVVFGGWIMIVIAQRNGAYISQKYPFCPLDNVDFVYIGDGQCNFPKGSESNILNCGWEGGDCVTFNDMLPDCMVKNPSLLGNGICNGGKYNTIECGWDSTDCVEFNEKYPDCNVNDPNKLNDGICDSGPYNTAECEFDGGDCIIFNLLYPNCKVEHISWLGDGKCHGNLYNTAECCLDGGDCVEFNNQYPNCKVEKPYLVGNGHCDGDSYATIECGYDGGDCFLE